MSGELTLTGGTLTSDGGGSIISGPTFELVQQDPLSSSHDHTANSQDHSHDHKAHSSNDGSCCSKPTVVHHSIVHVPKAEELMAKGPEEVFNALAGLIRQAPYEPWVELIKQLRKMNQNLISDMLNVTGGEGHSFLHWAAKRSDDVRFLKYLSENVPRATMNIKSQDSVGMTPLHWCCTEGRIPHAACLIDNGADLESKDKSGCTPLLIAAQYGHVEMVAFLLQKGANGTAVDSSNDSALHWAAYKGSIQVCGLLMWRGELHWTTTDSYGQTTLHLASLRGHTTVVRYLLQEGTRQERRQVLFLKDKNGKTPLDLAITKKRPNVASLLKEEMADFDTRGRLHRALSKASRQFCSVHSWRVWMGCVTSDMDAQDEPAKFLFYWVLLNLFLHIPWYPFCFTPLQAGSGVMWDKMGFHLFNFGVMFTTWFSLFKTYTTDPGRLDEKSHKTPELRRLYEETLESYSDPENKMETPLCHTCNIARPLRSKHCRVARRCVLMFDHYCPFVGNTIGLYNYKWFYLFLLALTLEELGFILTCFIYASRVPHVSWGFIFGAFYMSIYLLMAGGMLIYHTQLSFANLTTNEHINIYRFKYLQNPNTGKYRNPFFRGLLGNFLARFNPDESLYVLPADHKALLDWQKIKKPNGIEIV